MDKLKDRIKFLRQKFNIPNQQSLAEILGVSLDRVKSIESGRVKKLHPEEVDALVKKFHLSPHWLLTGEGEMYKEPPAQQEEHGFVEIPYYPEVFAAAGTGAYNYEIAPKKIRFPKEFLEEVLELTQFNGVHIVTAIGDSMSPTIENGDKLFVIPFERENSQIRDGGIYIISCLSGVLVKRVYVNPFDNKMILKSDNPNIPDIEITGDELESCKIVGRVVGGTRRY